MTTVAILVMLALAAAATAVVAFAIGRRDDRILFYCDEDELEAFLSQGPPVDDREKTCRNAEKR